MSTHLTRRIARVLIQKSARDFFGAYKWRWRNWWLWEFPVNPNFYIFVPFYFYQTYVKHKPVVAVYQPGRVGSVAVTSAIRIAGGGLVLHAHSLSPELIQEMARPGISRPPELHEDIFRRTRVARCLRWVLRRRSPLKVVVLLRDPVGQSLSSFFYNFIYHTGHALVDYVWSPHELLRLYWLRKALTGYELFEKWFDRELHRFTGLDVLALPFDREQGWQEYQSRNLSVLVMKIELDNNCKNAVLSNFLGLKDLQIQVTNSAEEQSYASLYRSFRAIFSLKQEQLDTIYASRFVQHFYTSEEIASFKQQWMKVRT